MIQGENPKYGWNFLAGVSWAGAVAGVLLLARSGWSVAAGVLWLEDNRGGDVVAGVL